MQQKNKPARKPSIVFLGETDKNSFCFSHIDKEDKTLCEEMGF